MIGNNNQRSTTAASSNSSAAVNTASSGAAPPPPPGKYVNETLKILGGQDIDVSSNSSNSKKKRRSEHIADLERLLPPLFSQSATHSIPLSTVADDKTEGGDKTAKDVADKDATKTETSKNESVDEESSNQRRLKRLKLQLQHCKDLNDHEMKRRRKFVSSFVSLHTMYESGLDFIAKTSSLGNVPDNVMADEIPKSA